jgi:hypothetical protein
MPKGWANLDVPAINPERDGYCHPAQAKRTKCVCGATCRLHATTPASRCSCGRVHRKAPGAAFASTGAQPVRAGGRDGCPGMIPSPSSPESPEK